MSSLSKILRFYHSGFNLMFSATRSSFYFFFFTYRTVFHNLRKHFKDEIAYPFPTVTSLKSVQHSLNKNFFFLALSVSKYKTQNCHQVCKLAAQLQVLVSLWRVSSVYGLLNHTTFDDKPVTQHAPFSQAWLKYAPRFPHVVQRKASCLPGFTRDKSYASSCVTGAAAKNSCNTGKASHLCGVKV